MRRLAVLPVLLALFILAGCGETVIDSAKTEDAIESNLKKATGLQIAAVDCPSDVEVEPKATFDCTVEIEGGEEQVATLVIRNDDADVSLVNLAPAAGGDASGGDAGGSEGGEAGNSEGGAGGEEDGNGTATGDE